MVTGGYHQGGDILATPDPILSREDVAKLVSSMTAQGTAPLNELQVERFLNALARLQSNTPTGVSQISDSPTE